ncbi:hypothetical protein CGRA01v4_03379 [Colletotrichum graminicola]|nr:hypothetical protein CGRA01v4_03379 [Colletotrichum graminicola]
MAVAAFLSLNILVERQTYIGWVSLCATTTTITTAPSTLRYPPSLSLDSLRQLQPTPASEAVPQHHIPSSHTLITLDRPHIQPRALFISFSNAVLQKVRL